MYRDTIRRCEKFVHPQRDSLAKHQNYYGTVDSWGSNFTVESNEVRALVEISLCCQWDVTVYAPFALALKTMWIIAVPHLPLVKYGLSTLTVIQLQTVGMTIFSRSSSSSSSNLMFISFYLITHWYYHKTVSRMWTRTVGLVGWYQHFGERGWKLRTACLVGTYQHSGKNRLRTARIVGRYQHFEKKRLV